MRQHPGKRWFSFCLGLLVCGALLGAPATARADHDLCGSWKGGWVDYGSGHKGPLRANFVKISENCYEVQFSGRYWVVMPFRYRVVLTVSKVEGDKVYLSGVQHTPKLMGGTYTYSAVVEGCRFIADYDSCKYKGQFCMDRCGCCP